jgi:transposase, IS30 family
MSFLKEKIASIPNSNYYCNTLEKLDKGSVTVSCNTLDCDTRRDNMKKYRHLTFEDRIYIEVWQWERKSLNYIARRLGVHPSTVSRELKRGATGWLQIGYRADLGERRKRIEGAKKGRRPKLVGRLGELVVALLRRDWSPEQISGRLKLEQGIQLSHETIYSFVKRDKDSGGNLYLHLRHGKRRRRKRFAIPRVRQDILNRRHISQRPEIVNKRERIGDWERDLMFSQSRREALLTFVERKTLLTVLRKVQSKSPREIARQTIKAMKNKNCLTLTNDNGFEFREHQFESKVLGIPIYFTNPYSSWEKGTCENTNGLIRQYFPRDQKLKEMTHAKLRDIEKRLNSRPRKKLGFQTPLEACT